jgi:pimeloyl-ACP methyl ester carboxylesterase
LAQWAHRYAEVNGLDMHYVEQGRGPLVILAHGFPHTWFSWHRQIPAIAAAGYRVVAFDQRGMGQTSAPSDPALYDVPHTVGDLVGLLDHLGEEKAIFSGLDFGLFAIYDMAYHYPERMTAIIGLENPAWPHDPDCSPLSEAAALGRRHFYHLHYFTAESGVADAALNAAPRDLLAKVFYALSGDYHYIDVWNHPPGTGYLDALPNAPPLPWNWLSDLELEFFVSDYARSGFTGGLNWYRAMDLRWQQRRRFEGIPNPVPFYFIGSENDTDLEAFHGEDPLSRLHEQYSDLRAVEMIAHAGHMVQMERADDVTQLMLRFLNEVKSEAAETTGPMKAIDATPN